MDIIEKASEQKQLSINRCNALLASFVKETCDPNDYFIILNQLLNAVDAYNNVRHDTYNSKSTKEENVEEISPEKPNFMMAKIYRHFKTTVTFRDVSDTLAQVPSLSSLLIVIENGNKVTMFDRLVMVQCLIIRSILTDEYPSTQKYSILFLAYIRNYNHIGEFDYHRDSFKWEKLLESMEIFLAA
jgi:hypothetical protein